MWPRGSNYFELGSSFRPSPPGGYEELTRPEHLAGPHLVLSTVPCSLNSRTDNSHEEVDYLTPLVSRHTLLLIALQYYTALVNCEIAPLLLEIHITCRQHCCRYLNKKRNDRVSNWQKFLLYCRVRVSD